MRREGRKIGIQRVEIAIKKSGASCVSENGRVIFESKEGALAFDLAFLYIQMSSPSKYPP